MTGLADPAWRDRVTRALTLPYGADAEATLVIYQQAMMPTADELAPRRARERMAKAREEEAGRERAG